MKIHFHAGILLFWMITGFISLGLLLFLNFQVKPKTSDENKDLSVASEELVNPNFKSGSNQPDDKDFTASLLLKKLDEAKSSIEFAEAVVRNINKEFQIVQALFYIKEDHNIKEDQNNFRLIDSYAISESLSNAGFKLGDGINGQAAQDGQVKILSNIPEKYRMIDSGLGSGKPSYLGIVPFMHENECLALLEFSSFRERTINKKDVLEIFSMKAGQFLFNIIDNR
jgi:hypothetical protein